MPDQATKAASITDDELAEAIRVKGRQVRNGVKVLQLVLDHIPPETRRVPWNGRQDFYRNIPQPLRHLFLERLDALATRHSRLDTSTPEARSNPVPGQRSVPTEPVRTWPAQVVESPPTDLGNSRLFQRNLNWQPTLGPGGGITLRAPKPPP
jgi:hypothetical protein